MNLLLDPWVPLLDGGAFKQITYRELLCEDSDVALALTRDDMELSCLQLLVSLTQVIFLPPNKAELLQRIDLPMNGNDYDEAIAPFIDWFDLAHREHPFMQVRGVEAKDTTAIQKLFAGLPEGDGTHAFFNDRSEIEVVGLPAAAIALFNQASTSPNFGGGFKGALRGVPVTTLVRQESKSSLSETPQAGGLRRLVWWNVLPFEALKNWRLHWRDWSYDHFRKKQVDDRPTWVTPIHEKETIAAGDVGLLRGLFWQPTHVELVIEDEQGTCDVFDVTAKPIAREFRKAKFDYTIDGLWQHPHSARFTTLAGGETRTGYVSFRTTAPAWTQLSQFLFEKRVDNLEGSEPAPVVRQFGEIADNCGLELTLGGYRNKQASVVQRRHELMQLGAGWSYGAEDIRNIIDDSLGFRKELEKRIAVFSKVVGAQGMPAAATTFFYERSEELMHKQLLKLDFEQSEQQRKKLAEELSKLCLAIFDGLTRPFRHKPKMMIAIAKTRAGLEGDLARLRNELE